jgi:hypothetical protein
MKDDDDFNKLVRNTMLYGVGVMIMELKDGAVTNRIVPIDEYTQLGEHLKWVDQSTKETRK